MQSAVQNNSRRFPLKASLSTELASEPRPLDRDAEGVVLDSVASLPYHVDSPTLGFAGPRNPALRRPAATGNVA